MMKNRVSYAPTSQDLLSSLYNKIQEVGYG